MMKCCVDGCENEAIEARIKAEEKYFKEYRRIND